MKQYRVFLKGENFWMRQKGNPERFGFFKTVFVDAADRAEAEAHAIDTVRSDDKLRGSIVNDRDDPPMLFAEEIEETAVSAGSAGAEQGYVFFADYPAGN